MISFYDWAPAALDASGVPQSASCRAAANSRASPTAADVSARKDPEVQAQLCKRIQDAVDISDVFNKVAVHAARAGPESLAYALHRIARYCRLRRQDTGPTKRAARWVSLLREVHAVLSELDPQRLTDVVWSLAVLNHRETKLLAGICHQVFSQVDCYSPANMAITAWSFATLAYRDDLMLKRLNRQALGRLPEFEAQSLSNMAWSLATFRFKDDVLMQHIAIEAVRKMDNFSPQHVANTAWSYATLGRRAEVLFGSLERRARELLEDSHVDFCPLDLALCAWSFAWLAHASSSSRLLRDIAPTAKRRLSEFSSQQLANMLWGFDHANFEDVGFFATIGRWCCSRPEAFWRNAAGEELVSILTALRPYATPEWHGWEQLERLFFDGTLLPLANFLRLGNTEEGYTQGLRKLRTYHAGALYTRRLFQELGISFLGDGNDVRVKSKVDDLLAFYMTPPEPRWLPDGYDDDDEQACRAEIPGLLELCEVKRRVQPSSHFIALHLSAELTLTVEGHGDVIGEGEQGEDSELNARPRSCSRRIWRSVPTRPPRRSGLSFVRGEKFEDRADVSGDEDGALKTSTLRDYRRKHHAEVTALTQVADVIAGMDAELSPDGRSSSSSSPSPSLPPAAQRVTGWVELFVPHYPCSSCTGALVQFCSLYPGLAVRVGHDDWRHWLRRLDECWDGSDERHKNLSINARQLRDLDNDLGSVPEAYRLALRGTLGDVGIGPSSAGAATAAAAAKAPTASVARPRPSEDPAAFAGVNSKVGSGGGLGSAVVAASTQVSSLSLSGHGSVSGDGGRSGDRGVVGAPRSNSVSSKRQSFY
eukprot:TRINITY_DN35011_c0_g1_i1.p1 TRINITY_DN35011_c0_g1~~TRINITY_DN35011_c0_g1_i1.p1  ORF type:complete len:821 (+),score=106.74 TRINITY_DN35011_c0_g1_i1:69-2531(+)